ncbi:MAG: CHASE2 domain-containing protein [Candidatus Omnitrophica bacterium]|nr:CHASE2 domain-containing protein [Candidatus Omnitrophota bacterium]
MVNLKKILDLLAVAFQNVLLVLIFLAFAAILLCGSHARIFENSELGALDFRFHLRPFVFTSDKVVIVEIGEDSIAKLGRFPFDRGYHAVLIKALSEYGAKAVLMDIFFSEKGNGDPELEQAIKTTGNVYLPYVFDLDNTPKQKVIEAKGYTAQTLENFRQVAAGIGHINVIPDPDGKYRRVPLLVEYGNTLHPYLSLRLISAYLGLSAKDLKLYPGRYIQLGRKMRIPVDENSNVIVNYAGDWGRYYKHYSFVDILQSYVSLKKGEKPTLDLNVFKDKICIVGLTAAGTADLHPNPFSALYPALAVHSDIINSILNKQFIVRASKQTNQVILFLLGALIVWGVFATKPFKSFLILAGTIFSYSVLAILLFILFGIWVDMFYPFFALVALYLLSTLMISIREWKKKILVENEMKIAKKIQESFLPKTLPMTAGLDIAAIMYTAREVGGDLYDFYEFSPKRLGVMIGDVSGKGMPASLFMTTVSGAFKFFALSETKPHEALHNLNLKLTQDSPTGLFVTLYYSIFDMDKKIMTYANGGHLPVLYLPKGASAKALDVEDGYPLGMLESTYSGGQIAFSSGDIFVFYTDGITEARNAKGQMYGKERLISTIEKDRNFPARGLLSSIEKDVRKFEPQHKQSDDITFIVVKII